MPNIFAELLLASLRFAALWLIFNQLHHPQTRARLILAISLMALQYPLCRILFFASGSNFAVSVAFDTVLFLSLAFICEGEPQPRPKAEGSPLETKQDVSGKSSFLEGDWVRPLVSALYFNGMLQFINYILGCYMFAFTGKAPPSFSFLLYFWKAVEGLILLFWTFFYYRVARNMTVKMPVSFSLLIILTPLAGLAVISASTTAARPLLAYGANVFMYAGLFGTLIVVLNMCVFYLYTKLSVAHEALVFAGDLANTPPVWTPELGLSEPFIEKYEITARERDVVQSMLQGKTDKEIAVSLDIAVNTVQVHLKRIYRKTGVSGRFALSALIRGGNVKKRRSLLLSNRK